MIILSDKHSGLVCCVLDIFGGENYAYCYCHLKKNFCSFFNKYNTRGNKVKENSL